MNDHARAPTDGRKPDCSSSEKDARPSEERASVGSFAGEVFGELVGTLAAMRQGRHSKRLREMRRVPSSVVMTTGVMG